MRAGKVDCDKHQHLCQQAGIQAYPTIRLYGGAPDGADSKQVSHIVWCSTSRVGVSLSLTFLQVKVKEASPFSALKHPYRQRFV